MKANIKCTRNMLSFLEKMATSTDAKVTEVCDFTVIESLNDEISDAELEAILGENSIKGFRTVKRYMR